jgi:hypothetical protein
MRAQTVRERTARLVVKDGETHARRCAWATLTLFVDGAFDLGRGDSVRCLVIADIVRRLPAVPFHVLVAIVGFPDALALCFVILARDRNHDHVVVFVVCHVNLHHVRRNPNATVEGSGGSVPPRCLYKGKLYDREPHSLGFQFRISVIGALPVSSTSVFIRNRRPSRETMIGNSPLVAVRRRSSS